MIALIILGGVLYKIILGGKKTDEGEEGLAWTSVTAHIFVPPQQRQAYIDLKQANAGKDLQKNPEIMQALRKTLMHRAIYQIPLVLDLQTQGPSSDKLYKKGMITDDFHGKYKQMKLYFDEEFPEVAQEANMLTPGWGEAIWQQANQMYQAKKLQTERVKKEERAANGFIDDDESFVVRDPPPTAAPHGQQPKKL